GAKSWWPRRGAAKHARRATARTHAGACDTFCKPPRRVTMAAKERQARGTYPVCFAFFHSCRRASERGSCGYPKLFLLLRFLSAARSEAAASPHIPMQSGAFLRANSGIDTARWRYRRFFWSGRGDSVGRGDTDGSSSSPPTRNLTTS